MVTHLQHQLMYLELYIITQHIHMKDKLHN